MLHPASQRLRQSRPAALPARFASHCPLPAVSSWAVHVVFHRSASVSLIFLKMHICNGILDFVSRYMKLNVSTLRRDATQSRAKDWARLSAGVDASV